MKKTVESGFCPIESQRLVKADASLDSNYTLELSYAHKRSAYDTCQSGKIFPIRDDSASWVVTR
jgi:hypothetical protein